MDFEIDDLAVFGWVLIRENSPVCNERHDYVSI
jgi:hypothetical protein